jgi:hypothetical protein
MVGVEAAGQENGGKRKNILFLEGNLHSLTDNAGPQSICHLPAPPLALLWVDSRLGAPAAKSHCADPKTSFGINALTD